MHMRAKLAAATTMLLVVACQSDKSSSTLTAPNARASRAIAAVTPAAMPTSLFIFPSIVQNGPLSTTPIGAVFVNSIADVDRTLQVTSSNPAALSNVIATVTIPAGSNQTTFAMTPAIVTAATPTTISLSGGGTTLSTPVTVFPAGATLPPPTLDSIFATPITVKAGTTANVTVRLTAPAPAGGLVVGLYVNLPLTAQLPPLVTVPAGARSITVPITTSIGFPNSTTTPRIQAANGYVIVGNGINVVTGPPTSPPPLGMGSVALNPSTVVGGNTVQGTVTLTGVAPAGGALVTLVSTDTGVATTAANVLVPAGSTSATFAIATKIVATATSSNIAGGFAGGFLTTTLHVNPVATTPPPSSGPLAAPSLLSPAADSRFAAHATVSFDWGDVSGGATYTIQVSDNDKFSSTLVTQTVASSQFSIATLPTKTLWWRVRANAASGAAGTFSASRRFELK